MDSGFALQSHMTSAQQCHDHHWIPDSSPVVFTRRVIQLLKSQQVSHLPGSKSKQNQITFRVQLFRHLGRPESDPRL